MPRFLNEFMTRITALAEHAASYSNLLLIAGCVPLIGVIYYLVIRKEDRRVIVGSIRQRQRKEML